MRLRMNQCGTVFLLAAAMWMSPTASAQDAGGRLNPFVEQPGVHEFSGRMIARPVQNNASGNKLARQHVEANYTVVKYDPDLDWYVIQIPQGQNEDSVAATLMGMNFFEFVEPDWICYPVDTPNDTRFAEQWALTKIQAPTAWNYNTGFNGITVGICDTGLRTTHLDLPSRRREGYNAVDDLWETNGGNVNDIHGHGTHTTGIAAARGNNARGVSGVGWNYAHRIIKVSNAANGGSTIATLTHAAVFSSQQGDRVVSVSYSGVNDAAVRAAATTVKNNGGLLFWAAGNDGVAMNSPGRDADDLVVVGSTNETDGRSSFSNYGLYVDLFAPGSNILSLSNAGDDSYTTMSGTSMATPCAAGLAALIWSQNPAFTPEEVEAHLKDTCDNVGSSNTFGYGRINAAKAMQGSARHSLGSTWQGGNGQNGAMFDITCLNPNGITITAFDFNNLTAGNANLEVYYVTNRTTYVGKEGNAGAWTLLGAQTGLATEPEGEPTGINIGGLTINSGQTVGIYVTRTDVGLLRYTNGPLGAYSTADLRWENRGVGVVYPFGTTFANRVFNGSVHYRVNVGGILPTLAPAAYNFIPFGNDTCTMHQVYNKNLFSGPVIMESVGFAPNTSIVGETATAAITIRMGYTNKIPGQDTGSGGLDSVLANNPSGAMTTLYTSLRGDGRTFMSNGSIEHSMFFDFSRSFTYNPALGNLLVEIVSINNSSVDTSVSRAAGSSESSRAYNSVRFGNAASPTTATRMDLGWRPTVLDFTLTASGVCPGLVTVEWENATPNSTVALIFAKNTGNFVIPFGPCQGTVLGLGSQSIRLVNTFPSGANGSGTRSGQSQSGACHGFMQMHDLPNCRLTNVVQHP